MKNYKIYKGKVQIFQDFKFYKIILKEDNREIRFFLIIYKFKIKKKIYKFKSHSKIKIKFVNKMNYKI